jgi:Sigma-70, region 4
VRAAIASLPVREQKVISLYYYGEATMKQIGAEIGVNESRVSQLHARAIRRLRDALEVMMPRAEAAQALRGAILEFQQKPRMANTTLAQTSSMPGVVVPYPKVSRARNKSANRQAVPARKTARIAKITRRASESVAAAAVAR